MAFYSAGSRGHSSVTPTSFAGLEALGVWGQPAAPVDYLASIPPSNRPIVEAWVAEAVPKVMNRQIRTGFIAAKYVPIASPAGLPFVEKIGQPTDAEKLVWAEEWKRGQYTDVIRKALEKFAACAADPSSYGVSGILQTATTTCPFKEIVNIIPLPPWFNEEAHLEIYKGYGALPTENGFFTQDTWVQESVIEIEWSRARFWWGVSDQKINANTRQGIDAIELGSPWSPDRGAAEWMFPPYVWGQIVQVTGDRWRLNKFATSGNLRLEFHQRRGDPFVGSGSNDPVGWFPYPIVTKQGYDIITNSIPTASDYQTWVDWYNAIPYVAGEWRNHLALRVELVDKKTGLSLKLQSGEEKVLIALIEWKPDAPTGLKVAMATRAGLTPINIPEVETDEMVDAFALRTVEDEAELDARISADPDFAAVVEDISVHPIASEMAEKAAAQLIDTVTIVKIYGPVKDKKKKSFMQEYGVYIAAALLVAGVVIALIPAATGTAATGAATTTTTTAATEAAVLQAAGTSAAQAAGGVTSAGLAAGGGEAAGAGLLATAGKTLAAPALKYGIATAMGSESGQDAAMNEVWAAVGSEIVPGLATEIAPDGTVELIQDAQVWLDKYVPEEVQGIAEAYLKGQIKEEVAERLIREKGYEMPVGFEQWKRDREQRGDTELRAGGGFPVVPVAIGAGALGLIFLLAKFKK